MITKLSGIETHSARTGTRTGRHAAAEDTLRVLMGRKRTTSTLHRSTAEAAPGYDHEAVSYGIETHSARTDRAHAPDATERRTLRVLMGEAKRRTDTASKHRERQHQGYDREGEL
jgi:hypothetical protein